jgi:SAM-dependent methyltransferase
MSPQLLRRVGKSLLGRCRAFLGAGFDYRAAYRRADLTRDWWSIVGPATREEHEALGRGKRQQLIDQGMTPDSRVLDVGCGTGQRRAPTAAPTSPRRRSPFAATAFAGRTSPSCGTR